MMRTPAKKDTGLQGSGGSPRSTERAGPSALSVRRSIGEWEAGKTEPKAKSPANSRPEAAPRTTQTLPSTSGMRRASVEAASPAKKAEPKYPNFTAEARACLNKAKLHLSNSRNLKTEIKTEVVAAINRLYEIVKESEKSKISVAATTTSTIDQTVQPLISSHTSGSSLLTSLDGNEELSKKLDENNGPAEDAGIPVAVTAGGDGSQSRILSESSPRRSQSSIGAAPVERAESLLIRAQAMGAEVEEAMGKSGNLKREIKSTINKNIIELLQIIASLVSLAKSSSKEERGANGMGDTEVSTQTGSDDGARVPTMVDVLKESELRKCRGRSG
ncbi:hypothetical protein PYW07_013563 [Mythimna separata]|uniref:Uncharacterized protein n=1 Tax=Mythimna separata TaxID=271217 RepID=A0AAD8DP12_MYTSE|nr:hypothetical protein PYW07_013563 [Mythimna separata]